LSPALTQTFAPTGKLRACINLGNAVLAGKSVSTGEIYGTSVDLAREFANRLGVAVELIVVETAAKSVEAVRQGRADIGFFAIDPTRSEGIAFTAPYVLIEGSYLVRQDSPLQSNDEVDVAKHRIMVAKGSAYDLYLSRTLTLATLVRTVASQDVVNDFLAQNIDVAAAVKQQLQADALRVPGVRLLPGRFMVIQQAMGLPHAYGADAAQALREFVEAMKANQFVSQRLVWHGIEGAVVAPPAIKPSHNKQQCCVIAAAGLG
jgi:polar amino acid transport system substrate-binding protein